MNAPVERKGKWMQTVSGRAFWPLDPHPEEIDIEDIAHALGHMCRYGGHSSRFYSVAEHSTLVSYFVPPEHALAGLMHDATEAYLVDVPRPIKHNLPTYREIEGQLWAVIAVRFGLPLELPQAVHDADVAVLFAEQKALMKPSPLPDWGMGLTTPIDASSAHVVGWNPMTAKHDFLRRFHHLYKGK
mgnify:CR=1 FL=1